ncbi:complex I NDUFA9 subunit family protein [Propionivibrio sp.]|uniref:complex I NDUFA9 subunit family protein n=1 Tax=Propionivibrio sp. TaxID=2212460 RepID=UPI0039E2F905
MSTRVVLLGGGGFIGKSLARRLAGPGFEVTVPTRRPGARAALALLPGVRLVACDVHDPRQLARLFADADAVVNLVGILHDGDSVRPYGRRFAAAHVELPRKVVAAMRAAGVRRLLHVSALKASDTAPSAYLRSKAAGEAVVLEAAGAIDATIFRPSVVFGPEDAFLNRFASLLRVFPVLPIAGAGTRFQPVYVGDVAEACAAALDDRATYGTIYELGGPKVYTLRQLVEYVGSLIGRPRPVIDLPGPLARLQACMLGLLPNPPMSPDNLRSLQVDNVTDGQHDFPGWRPQPLEAVAPTYLSRIGAGSRYDELRRRAAR